MPFLKRYSIGICSLLLLIPFQFIDITKSALAETWLPVKVSVYSNDDKVDQKSFSVPVDVKVYWDCSLNGDKYAFGSFLITDNNETVIIKADRMSGTRSGSFEARAGTVYIIKAYGNSGYDSDQNIHFGTAQGTVSYLNPYDWQIYDNTFSGVWKNSLLYLPEKISHTGQYFYEKSLALNKRSDLGVRNYDIPVWFQADIGDKPDAATLEIQPGIRIYRCNASGEMVHEPLKLNLVGYNRKKLNGFFILPANFGFLVDVNTGKYTFSESGASGGFVCHYKIEYKLDDAAPNIPESPSPIRVDKVKKINGRVHTNLNPVELAWAVPQDNASSFKEKTIISGIKDYQVLILDILKNKTTFSDWLIKPNETLALEEGEYVIKVKARDYEGNESGYSDPFQLVIDRSINQVSIQNDPKPIQLNYQNGTYNVSFKWEQVQDISGIKYQVALTNSLVEPSGNWDVVDSNQCTFYNRPFSDTTLYAYIRAIDGVGNVSQWTRTDGFKIWSPPASFSVTPSANLINGQALYKIELDFNNIEAAKYIIERVETTGVRSMEITYQQLMQNGFKYIDTNVQKHGQYQYVVYTQNALGVNSLKTTSSFVTIPNISAPSVNLVVKNGGEVIINEQLAKNSNLVFDISSKQDLEDDDIRFKICYKNLDITNSPTVSFPNVFQSNPISIKDLDLNSGNYEFWLEFQEFYGNLSVSEVSSTPHRIFNIL